jgi:hypothetical protein
MKITTGTLLFNGKVLMPEGMLKAQLDQLYYLSDQIIFVEGATKADKTTHYYDGNVTPFTPDGRSTDGCLDLVKNYPDPDKKIIIIESKGFWNGKTQMCNEWSKIATGDYFWQIDMDEFYFKKDINRMKAILSKYKPNIVHFFANNFWGDFKHCINETSPYTWGNEAPWMRIFKHVPGCSWERHEPPTYLFPDGTKVNNSKIIPREETLKIGIKMFHYNYVTPEQINFKTQFYHQDWTSILYEKWLQDKSVLINNSRVVEYNGEHPEWVRDIIKNY